MISQAILDMPKRVTVSPGGKTHIFEMAVLGLTPEKL
jgi:hypothetical protein